MGNMRANRRAAGPVINGTRGPRTVCSRVQTPRGIVAFTLGRSRGIPLLMHGTGAACAALPCKSTDRFDALPGTGAALPDAVIVRSSTRRTVRSRVFA